jgi:hypothetical protein
MSTKIRYIGFYRIVVPDRPGESYRILSALSEREVDLVAFSVISLEGGGSQLTIYPEEDTPIVEAAEAAGLHLDGPHPALVAHGADKRGALAELHRTLYNAGVNVLFATAVTDGRGDYGYIVHVSPEDFPATAVALDL